VIPCQPNFPYTYCLLSHDDGVGNRVELGVLEGPVDSTPPVTRASVSPSPNKAGWNRADITVTLSASDEPGGSGVQQLTFRTSGAQRTAQTTVSGSTAVLPVIVTEGRTTITFFATDQTGNAEKAQDLLLRLDKTPPEASVRFNIAQRDVAVFGRDPGSGVPSDPISPTATTATPNRVDAEDGDDDAASSQLRTYRVVDLADNVLQLSLAVRGSPRQTRATVTSIKYEDATAVTPSSNSARFQWTLTADGLLRRLEQTLQVQDQDDTQSVQARFDARQHLSRTPEGLLLVELNTNKGTLSIDSL
jgi:hypothetical protein